MGCNLYWLLTVTKFKSKHLLKNTITYKISEFLASPKLGLLFLLTTKCRTENDVINWIRNFLVIRVWKEISVTTCMKYFFFLRAWPELVAISIGHTNVNVFRLYFSCLCHDQVNWRREIDILIIFLNSEQLQMCYNSEIIAFTYRYKITWKIFSISWGFQKQKNTAWSIWNNKVQYISRKPKHLTTM